MKSLIITDWFHSYPHKCYKVNHIQTLTLNRYFTKEILAQKKILPAFTHNVFFYALQDSNMQPGQMTCSWIQFLSSKLILWKRKKKTPQCAKNCRSLTSDPLSHISKETIYSSKWQASWVTHLNSAVVKQRWQVSGKGELTAAFCFWPTLHNICTNSF